MSEPKSIKVVVYHRGYGCETGCCGHAVRLSENDEYDDFGFEFDHPWDFEKMDDDARRAWAVEFAAKAVEREYGKDHVVDLDWDECTVTNYC